MRIGMIGLGRMGANMVRRLLQGGHECVAYDPKAEAVQAVSAFGAQAARSPHELVRLLSPPRAVWIMVPAAIVDAVIEPAAGARDLFVEEAGAIGRLTRSQARVVGPSRVHAPQQFLYPFARESGHQHRQATGARTSC